MIKNYGNDKINKMSILKIDNNIKMVRHNLLV